MKPCTDYIEKILSSIDGQLSDSEEQELQAHLAVCEGCRSLYSAYKEIDLGISAGEEEAPEGLSQAVMAAIHRESQERSPLHILKRARFTLIAAAAAVVILITGKHISFDLPITRSDTTSAAAEACADNAPAGGAEEACAEAPGAEAPVEEGYSGQLLPATAAEEAPQEAPETPWGQEAMTENEKVLGDDGMTDNSASTATTWSIQEVLDALEEDGCIGDLYPLSMKEAELLELLPDCEKITLSSGPVVYQTTLEAHNAVSDRLKPVPSAKAPESETVFYYLMP